MQGRTKLLIDGEWVSSNRTPFGGDTQSGLGRELGRHGLEELLEVKSTTGA